MTYDPSGGWHTGEGPDWKALRLETTETELRRVTEENRKLRAELAESKQDAARWRTFCERSDLSGDILAALEIWGGPTDSGEPNPRFKTVVQIIDAACNPVAIRALLDRLKAAEAENERLRTALRPALDALLASVDVVEHEYVTDWRHGIPTRKAQLDAKAQDLAEHKQAIELLAAALEDTDAR